MDELQNVLRFMDDISAHREELADRCAKTAETVLGWPSHGKQLANAYGRVIRNHD